MTTKSARSLYTELETKRKPFLDRARDAAQLTIPSLVPFEGEGAHTRFATPFQGVGARGVNNLASKLLLSLFPPNTPFFRLVVAEQMLAQIAQVGTAQSEVEASLSSVERSVMSEFETSAMRPRVFECLKHAVVTGNGLAYLPDEGGMRFFPLSNYVVDRDPMGNVETIVTKECVSPVMLPAAVQALIRDMPESRERTVDVFTHVCRTGPDRSKVRQEIAGKTVPGSEGTYTTESMPYIPLRFSHVAGEAYGRGHVEEYYGDLQSLEGLSQAIVEGSAAAARVLFLLAPNGFTQERDLATKPNCGFAIGNRDDVHVLALEKHADFRIAYETMSKIEGRLEFAFLLNTAIQRQAERVTAEEIRYMAQELEDTLGGVYSVLSQDFQLPLVRRLLAQLQKAKKIQALPKSVSPAILTGIDALGRGHELTRLSTAAAAAQQLFGQGALEYLNTGEGVRRVFVAAGVNVKDLLRSEEEVQSARAQQQQMQLVETLGPEVTRQAGSMMQQAAAQPEQGA